MLQPRHCARPSPMTAQSRMTSLLSESVGAGAPVDNHDETYSTSGFWAPTPAAHLSLSCSEVRAFVAFAQAANVSTTSFQIPFELVVEIQNQVTL